jgi:hypothetical protein
MAKPKFTKGYLDKLQEFVGKDLTIEKVEAQINTAWVEQPKLGNQNVVRKLRRLDIPRTGNLSLVFVIPHAKQVRDEYQLTRDIEDDVSFAEFTTLSFTENGFTIGLATIRLTYVIKYVPPVTDNERI